MPLETGLCRSTIGSVEKSKEEFGRWLRQLRDSAELTQTDVAREMYARFGSRVDPAAISGYENGENSPDGRRWWQLLQVYGVEWERQPAVPLAEVPTRLGELSAEVAALRGDMADMREAFRLLSAGWDDLAGRVRAINERRDAGE